MRITTSVLGLLVIVSLSACTSTDGLDTNRSGAGSPITKADITYGALAEQYNGKIKQLGTLWCRTDVVIEWREVDAQGQPTNMRREKGEGKFFFRRPGDTALLVEKLGQIYLWAGSDKERYWLFDVTDSDAKKAYLGTFAGLGKPGTRRYPLPVRPDAVPLLLGLVPLPPIDGANLEPEVEMYEGQYLIEMLEARLRMLIDPQTFRPTRVDLLDDQGFSVLTAKLQGRFKVEVPGVPNARRPIICERAAVTVAGYESKLTIAMDEATADPGRMRKQMFDFDALCKGLKTNDIISLDPPFAE